MTSQTRATLKSYFNTNDQPTEAQFADLIDSGLNLADETNWTLGSGVDEYELVYDHDTARFVLRAPLLHNYGTGNIFVGVGAGNHTTTGSVLTAVGFEALPVVTTAIDLTAFGYQALGAATTGSFNQAIGYRALYRLVDGMYNTASGQGALENVVSATYNTAMGFHCLQKATAGTNTAVGFVALQETTTGDSNTAFGAQAGKSNVTGSGNVFLGNGAGYYETAGNRLFIDNTYRASEADGRAKALIYGVFDAAVANQALTFNVGSMGFFGHVSAAQPTKAGHNNWAALSDVVAALVAIGILDTA